MSLPYWSHDGENHDLHATAEDARERCEHALDAYRSRYPDRSAEVMWGVVLEHAVEVERHAHRDGCGPDTCDDGCEARAGRHDDRVLWALAAVPGAEDLATRAARMLGGAGDGSPLGDLAAALDALDEARRALAEVTLDRLRDGGHRVADLDRAIPIAALRCPLCGSDVVWRLGSSPGSTATAHCGDGGWATRMVAAGRPACPWKGTTIARLVDGAVVALHPVSRAAMPVEVVRG